MFNIIISQDVLERILTSEQKKPDKARSLLLELLQQQKIDVSPKLLEYITCIPAHHEIVLQHPSSLFILDIPIVEAERIQKSYGVFCMSADAVDIAPLIDVNDEQTTGNQESLGKGWNTVLQGLRTIPSNALLLSDRYLFSKLSASQGNGIANVHAILDVLLPQRFLGEFHVTVVFDPQAVHKDYTFADIATRLNRIKQSLHRDYPIIMEVIGITSSCPVYEKIHNRRIVSNYYVVKAEHKLAAFNGAQATTEQTITPQALFTVDSLMGHSTPPLKSIDQILSTLRTFSSWTLRISDHSLYRYAVNGRSMEKCNGVKNRIISIFQ